MINLQTSSTAESKFSFAEYETGSSSIEGPFSFRAQPRLAFAEELDRLSRYEITKYCSLILLRSSLWTIGALTLFGLIERLTWVNAHVPANGTLFSSGSVKIIGAVALLGVVAGLFMARWVYRRFLKEFCTSEFYPMISRFLKDDLRSLAGVIARIHESQRVAVFFRGLRAIEQAAPESYMAALIRTVHQREKVSVDEMMILCNEGTRLARERDEKAAEMYLIAGLEALNGWHPPVN